MTDLYICDLIEGRAEQLLLDTEGEGRQRPCLVARDFRWSPDGRLLLFWYDFGEGQSWAVVDVASARVTKLVGHVSELRVISGPRPDAPFATDIAPTAPRAPP